MKNLVLITLLTIVVFQAFGQIDKESVDSLIIARTNEKFFRNLSFGYVVNQKVSDNEKLWDQGQIEREFEVQSFTYFLKKRSGDLFYYRISGMMACVLQLDIKPNGQLINSPDFETLKKISNLIDINTVDRGTAIKAAIHHLTNKKVKDNDCFLIYDLNEGTVYWEIRSRTGLKNIIEQTARIDARTATYIRTDNFEYQRTLLH